MLITHAKYNDLFAYFSLQRYSVQFPSELQSPVNISFRMEIPQGMKNTGSTYKAIGTPLRLFVTTDGGTSVCFCFLFRFQMFVFFFVVYITGFFFQSIGCWIMVLNVILPSSQSSRYA